MSPRGKMPPPTLAIAVGKDKPPAGPPPDMNPGGEAGQQADMICPSCGDKITVTLAPAEGTEPPAGAEGGTPPGGGEYGQ